MRLIRLNAGIKRTISIHEIIDTYKYPVIAISVHLIIAAIRCVSAVYGPIRLQGDEAQYWSWSQHLGWSYYSKPPLIAYCNYITEWLFGHSELSVRINAIFCGILIGLVTYLFTYKVYSSHQKALWASMLVLVMPFYFDISSIYSTDSILLLCWLLAAYFYWQASGTNKWRYWIAMGVSIGVGSLGKYAMLFFILTLLLYLLFEDRSKFSNPALYVSLLLGIAIFVPVIIWNAKHQFVGYQHLVDLSGVHDESRPILKKLLNILSFIGGQILIASPLFIVMYCKMFKQGRHDKLTRFFFIPMFIILGIFMMESVIKKREADINWTMFVYTGLPILLASYIIDFHKEKIAKILFGITVSLLLIVTTIPIWSSPVSKRILPVKADPMKELYVWRDMAKSVDSIYTGCNNPSKTIIFSDQYMCVSELMFYLYPDKQIYFYNSGSRMCEYQLWKGVEQYNNKNYDALFVHFTPYDKIDPNENNMPSSVAGAFEKIDSHIVKTYYYRGELAYVVDIYKMKKLKTIQIASPN